HERRILAGRSFKHAALGIGSSKNSRYRSARSKGFDLIVVEWICLPHSREEQRRILASRSYEVGCRVAELVYRYGFGRPCAPRIDQQHRPPCFAVGGRRRNQRRRYISSEGKRWNAKQVEKIRLFQREQPSF